MTLSTLSQTPWALMATLMLLLVASQVTQLAHAQTVKTEKFTAAVYEHSPFVPKDSLKQVVSRKSALELMQSNLHVYSEQAKLAATKGANIIVFPEDGLYGYIFTRETIRPYLETIPDPDVVTWSPCDDPTRFPNTEVQRQLSCMAKNNKLYVVANMGDLVPCDPTRQQNCPSDGALQFNTAVAYNPAGTLVAKYHKRNLYYESQFDRPVSRVKYFDTFFGRVGLFICFDILFESPAIDMVTTYGITSVAFPTAWRDALPLLSAVGWHSSFARGQKVNLLVANLHKPTERFQGSGIYTPDGYAGYYYDNRRNSRPSLIVREIDVIPTRSRYSSQLRKASALYAPISAEQMSGTSFQNKGYNFVPLTEKTAKVNVCNRDVCCSLDYASSSIGNPASSPTELIVLGAFDGFLNRKYYSRICSVYKCPKNNRTRCGSYTFQSNSTFSRAELVMHTPKERPVRHLFPQVVLVTPNGQLQLAKPEQVKMGVDGVPTLRWTGGKSPLITMAIVAREYDKDPVPGGVNSLYNLDRPFAVLLPVAVILTLRMVHA